MSEHRAGTDWSADAPVFAAWKAFAESESTPFTIPGHKRRAGRLDPALGRLLDADVALYGGIDTVKLTGGVLAQAEQLAAEFWQADWCRFSTGGSTHANQAVCLALGRPGDTVLVTRTAHRSTLLGLVMAGLRPVWIPASVDERFGVPAGMDLEALRTALAAHPEAVGVLCVDPSYLGTISDLPAIVDAAHRSNVPVIVDQAWGAHLGVEPGYPAHALALGADVMVMSAHKTLPAFSQAAVVAARTTRLDADRLERAFEAANTTSPAGAILASIDASRALLSSTYGQSLLVQLADRVEELRSALRRAGVSTLAPDAFAPGRFDPAKLVVMTAPSGHSGLAVESALLERGVPVEMADRDTVVPQVTLADDAESISLLTAGLLDACTGPATPRPVVVAAQWTHSAPQLLTPREAFFARHTSVAFDDCLGLISAELVAPYPPGVPILVPGEQITAESLAALRSSAASGTRIAYAADPTLASLQTVVADELSSEA